ncbi:hypothetical protein O3M35_002697 [Rhynocoris fuscipes]|uniref:Sperm microtubule inner protein 1 C-terminal domain-containing protein n=1 Tax=Rhynocoris fuscipes TaxID=488301 RepID=A0AAW1CTW3_9HEMI
MTASIRRAIAMKEMEEKQIKIRLKWFQKYYEYLKSAKEEDEDIEISPLIVKLIEEVANMRKDKYEREQRTLAWKQAKKEAAKKAEGDDKFELDEEYLRRGPMMPIEKEIRDQLYIGTTYTGEGRWLYLKFRNRKAPYNRYYDPMTDTQVFGWKIEERALPANKQHARQRIIEPQFYRRTGVKGETLRNRQPTTGLVEIDSLS